MANHTQKIIATEKYKNYCYVPLCKVVISRIPPKRCVRLVLSRYFETSACPDGDRGCSGPYIFDYIHLGQDDTTLETQYGIVPTSFKLFVFSTMDAIADQVSESRKIQSPCANRIPSQCIKHSEKSDLEAAPHANPTLHFRHHSLSGL